MGDDVLFERSTCSALVITCSDFRFKSIERTFAGVAGLKDDYDLIARPGAIRSLVSARSIAARQTMEEEIEMLRKLHRFTRILMVNHLSCRAYDDLVSRKVEREIHLAHLRAAGPALERQYAGVTAEAYLVELVDGALRVDRIGAG